MVYTPESVKALAEQFDSCAGDLDIELKVNVSSALGELAKLHEIANYIESLDLHSLSSVRALAFRESMPFFEVCRGLVRMRSERHPSATSTPK
jgi:hypothetical protein